jgi:tRNA G18 (ribose-2'-O)-methylase SpoU
MMGIFALRCREDCLPTVFFQPTLNEHFEHQNVANTIKNEKFELQNVASTVEKAISSSKILPNSMEDAQNRKSPKKSQTGKNNPQTTPDVKQNACEND